MHIHRSSHHHLHQPPHPTIRIRIRIRRLVRRSITISKSHIVQYAALKHPYHSGDHARDEQEEAEPEPEAHKAPTLFLATLFDEPGVAAWDVSGIREEMSGGPSIPVFQFGSRGIPAFFVEVYGGREALPEGWVADVGHGCFRMLVYLHAGCCSYMLRRRGARGRYARQHKAGDRGLRSGLRNAGRDWCWSWSRLANIGVVLL